MVLVVTRALARHCVLYSVTCHTPEVSQHPLRSLRGIIIIKAPQIEATCTVRQMRRRATLALARAQTAQLHTISREEQRKPAPNPDENRCKRAHMHTGKGS